MKTCYSITDFRSDQVFSNNSGKSWGKVFKDTLFDEAVSLLKNVHHFVLRTTKTC